MFTAEKDDFPLTLDGLFGGKLIYELDMKKAAAEIIKRIIAKRKALSLPASTPAAL